MKIYVICFEESAAPAIYAMLYSYDVICKRTILNERGTTSIIEANGWCIMRSIICGWWLLCCRWSLVSRVALRACVFFVANKHKTRDLGRKYPFSALDILTALFHENVSEQYDIGINDHSLCLPPSTTTMS